MAGQADNNFDYLLIIILRMHDFLYFFYFIRLVFLLMVGGGNSEVNYQKHREDERLDDSHQYL